MSWLERKYISLLCPSFRNYKKKSESLYTFSCPQCNDSKTNRYKARGYIYEKDNSYNYFCHNCQASMRFDKFLATQNAELYKQYLFDKFETFKIDDKSKEQKTINLVDKNLEEYFTKLTHLPSDHLAIKYLKNRQIPMSKWNQFYYTANLNKSKMIFEETYKDRQLSEDARIVLPVKNESGVLTGLVCRAIGNSKLRYVNLKANENISEQLFNIENVDKSKRITIVEGPIDSLFLDNSIAVLGADFIKAIPFINVNRDIFVLDNQPRNPNIIQNMKTLATFGCSLVIWPNNIKEKDINEMVLKGLNPKQIIEENIYSGLQLELKIAQWSKC